MAFLHHWKLLSLQVFILSILFNQVNADGECYFPGGAWARDYLPCDPYAPTTACCPTGYTCFSNQLCVATHPDVINSTSPVGTSLRPGCTNPAWDELICGDFCLNNPRDDNLGDIAACGSNTFCCGADVRNGNCNCREGKGVFSVPSGDPVTIIGYAELEHTTTALVPGPSPTSKHNSASATSTSTLTAAPVPVTSSTGFKAGLGAGIPVLIIIICVIIYIWWHHKHRPNPKEELELSRTKQWQPAANGDINGIGPSRSTVTQGAYPPPPGDIAPDSQPFEDPVPTNEPDRAHTTTQLSTLNFPTPGPHLNMNNPYAPPPVGHGQERTPSPVDSEAPTQVSWRQGRRSGNDLRPVEAPGAEANQGSVWVMAGSGRPRQPS